jgi:5-methylcytosine-specific restriction protein A
MPQQPPRFSFVKRAPAVSWQRPGKNARRRLRGRAGQRDRARILAEEPLCRPCLEAGRVTPSEEVDHISDDVPDELWDARENKQGICKPCHTAKTARESAAGRSGGRGG